MIACLSLMKSSLTPLGKSVFFLLPLGLLPGMSAADAAIQKKIYGSRTKTLIISNKEMEDIIIIVKPPEESGLLIKGISETIKHETKEQKEVFLPILLGTIPSSLLGKALAVRVLIRAGENF